MKFGAIVSCGALLLLSMTANAQSEFYLKNGDRVVFYGDSITDQRLYTTFTETFVVTRFPKKNVTFVHSGWGGDRVGGGGGGPIELRLKRDVFAYKPTVMTIMLGMNDASYRPFDQAIFTTYSTGYQRIVDEVKRTVPGIRMTLIQPSPFDDVTRPPSFAGGYNAVLVRYGQFVKELANKENLHVADLNTSVATALEKAKQMDTSKPEGQNNLTLSQRIIPDRVHPGPGGHLLMAAALLKAWNAPALVSRTEIMLGDKVETQAENTRLSNVEFRNGTLSWTQTDNALPMPMDRNDPALVLAVQASDFVETLNQQPLKVTGLANARYQLAIDGKTVGNFTKEELAAGINLAMAPTPMVRQALDVHALTRLHNDLHFTRWRVVHVPHQDDLAPHYAKSMAALDKAEADIVKQQRAAAQPKPRRFELKPQ
jgi:lysophospholipase L1-like esterase